MKLSLGQPLPVSIVLKHDERPDRPNAWTCDVITSGGQKHGVAFGYTPGEALNNALLHIGYVDGFFQPTDISGDG